MRKRKFAGGGYTDQEATDLMERNIVPARASTYSGIMASGDTSGWSKDELEALKANEAAEKATTRKAAPAVKKAAPAATNASIPDYEAGEAPIKKSSSAGDMSRNGPIGDLVDEAKKNVGKKVPQRSGKRYAGQDGGSGLKYKAGGSVGAARRGDGIAQRGKTKGRMI